MSYAIVCDLERTNQLNLCPDKDLVDLCPPIEPYQVPKSPFYEVVKVFYTEIMKEWVEAGNKEEDFREKGPKIVLILDNASIHQKNRCCW